ncbi:putative bifunctional diguanylate cyclase/phosphodiesterase [Roseibium marinum]|uniref:Diguanylate cyclase (GGDEF)-like protein n=1 Tax=Roseibium marinum TaxID=281252 RepID=A0A2S3UQZ8_9HYPH|nr:EAL domain-containing protein [Roseibium marinum]POF30000.1 diguanylate cyclase (GGDEF)-like protein [Roseibium marinum]
MQRNHIWHWTVLCSFLIALFVFWTFFYASDPLEQEQVRSLEYDTVWSATNGRNEFYKYTTSISRYLQSGKPTDLEDALLKYEIFLGRMDMWKSGSFKAVLAKSPKSREALEALSLDLENLTPYMRSIATAQAGALHTILDSMAPRIETIAGTSYQSSIRRFSEERQAFQDRLMTEKRIVLGLLILAAGLLAVVMRQNRVLTSANDTIAGDAKRLTFMAKHDALTELPNRTLLSEYMIKARTHLAPGEHLLAVALDLDGFKAINDTLGHIGGDALLVALSRRLKDFVTGLPGRNLAARVGGDEFILVFRYSKHAIDVETTIRALASEFKTPLETTIGSVLVGASIGYALAGSRQATGYVILNADIALMEAKGAGRGTAMHFCEPMRTRLERRLQIERQLPNALRNAMIQPHYQLQVNIATGEPVGMEALARWTHSDIGPISPAEFIPIAEASGDVIELGRFMLRSACRDIQLMPGHIHVSVNLSMIQLMNDDIVELVCSTLRETGLPANRLKLEITESVFMQNTDFVSGVLTRLQNLGVSISLDDFGTGYSALSYLNKFKWNELKIDRSFVTACDASPKALNVVKVIKSLASKMNATLLIEGMETRKQVETFKNLGCLYAQGYFYSKPKPIFEIQRFLSGAETPLNVVALN